MVLASCAGGDVDLIDRFGNTNPERCCRLQGFEGARFAFSDFASTTDIVSIVSLEFIADCADASS